MLHAKKMLNNKMNQLCAIVIAMIGVFVAFGGVCHATPQNNIFDTQPFYTVQGSEKFYTNNERPKLYFSLSPLYQYATTAYDGSGEQVPAGDRLGKWNMVGLFYGQKAGDSSSLTNYMSAKTVLSTVTAQSATGLVSSSGSGSASTTATSYTGGDKGYNPAYPFRRGADITLDEASFDSTRDTFALLSVPLTYEKMGIRSQLKADMGCGIGFVCKGGIADTKQRRTAFTVDSMITNNIPQPAAATGSTTPTPNAQTQTDAVALQNALLDESSVKAIAQDLKLETANYNQVHPEDTHVAGFIHLPIKFYDKLGDIAVTLVPHVSVGCWLPTGHLADQNKVFSVQTGNGGFYVWTLDGAFIFDFPLIPQGAQTLQVVFGGGAAVSNERELTDQRVPSSRYQVGLIPWKTSIKKRPGNTWYVNASMKSNNFIDGASIFIDWMYTQHLQDEITLLENDATKKAEFTKGLPHMKKQSEWRNQQLSGGFDYKLADMLSLGLAVQGHLSGTHVYNAVTVMGSMSLEF